MSVSITKNDVNDLGYNFVSSSNPHGIHGKKNGHTIWWIGGDEGLFDDYTRNSLSTVQEVNQAYIKYIWDHT